MSQVWLVTGVSSGLGLEIALKALSFGSKVIGTGGKVLELDVTNAKACFEVFAQAQELYGRVDVLVNNAGISDDEAHEQMEVNFHGPLRLTQAALPGFRKRKTGAIVNITSVAVEGLSESLARELVEYNVQVLVVEPGAFRTNFLAAFKMPAKSSLEHYTAVKTVVENMAAYQDHQPGDAAKAAARIVEAVAGSGMAGSLKGKVLRLPLGPDCVERYEAKIKSMNQDLEAVREVAMSTNIE